MDGRTDHEFPHTSSFSHEFPDGQKEGGRLMSQVIPTTHNQKPSVRALQGNLNDIKAMPTTNGTSAASPISNGLWSGRELAQLGNPGASMASAFPALVPVRMAPHCCPARLSLGDKQPGLQKVPWTRNR